MPRVTITIPDKNAQPYRFQLDREVVTLGRGSENDIVIESGSVSVQHAEMHRLEGGYELRDVGSTNGIKLDGDRREIVPLRSGITLRLGDVAFDFMLTDEERDALDRERHQQASPISREPEIPPHNKPAPPAAIYVPETSSGGIGFGAMLMFLILAAAAFFAGLFVRFERETGGNLIDAIKAHSAEKSAPAVPGAPQSN